jgi:hypothetical protein
MNDKIVILLMPVVIFFTVVPLSLLFFVMASQISGNKKWIKLANYLFVGYYSILFSEQMQKYSEFQGI